MLQDGALAGPDIVEDEYTTDPLPLDIPTEILNLSENNVPDKLLEAYLNNYRITNAPNTLISENTIEETIEEGATEAIMLSTSFNTGFGKSYDYNIKELRNIVKSKPTYVKITRTPINGELIVKKLGQNVVLQAGDIVEASMLNEFMYDQGAEVCTAENQGRCTDGFSYIPYGEWTGLGEYQRTKI
jgi:hypothetical protein